MPLDGNFCEPVRTRFAEEKIQIPSQVVSKTYSILLLTKFRFRSRSGAVHDEPWRVEWTGLCSKTWDPYGGGNFVSFHIEKAYQNRDK